MPELVRATNIEAGYGNKQILFGANLSIAEGEAVSLLGGNGSGKSTLLNTISGFVRPWSGSILFDGREVAGMPAFRTFGLGIAQVSQARDLFPEMSVEANLRLGAYVRGGPVEELLEMVFDLFPRLRERASQTASLLSGGEQQMVAIGRALMGRSKLLLLDEPSGGLAPKIVTEIGEALIELKKRGLTMLLVEQNVRLALKVADRFLVLKRGVVTEEASIQGRTSLNDDLVRDIYL